MKFVICTKADGCFKKGKMYPVVGYNNGVNIAYETPQGDDEILIVHHYGDENDYVLLDPSRDLSVEFMYISFFK